MTQVVHSPHPLIPTANREVHVTRLITDTSLAAVVESFGIKLGDPNHPYFIQVNGVPIDLDKYTTTQVNDNDLITVRAALSGGGNSNVLSAVLEIALIVVVSYFTMGAGAAMVGLQAGSMAASAIGAALMIGGSLLIQSLFGAIQPNVNQQPVPYWTISGTQNQARPNMPMPVVFGTIQMAPDLDSTPYTTYESNNQWLYQTFNFGISDFGNYGGTPTGLTNLRFGFTDVSAYQNVQTQWSDSHGKLTLFPGNVNTQSGPALTNLEGPVQLTTSEVGCTAIGIDITGELFHVNGDGSLGTEECTLEILYRVTGTETWYNFFDAGEAVTSVTGYNPRQTQDYGYTNYVSSGSQGNVTLSNSNQNPYAVTFYQQVPLGQYDVQITRITQDFTTSNPNLQNSTTDYCNLNWSALRSYEPDTADYTGQTRLAVKIEATGQLNGTIATLNVMASAQCPVSSNGGETWTTEATSNPAWWFLWVARGGLADTGTRLYGAGLSDDQIDIAGICEWAAWCDANDLAFNYVEGSPRTLADMLTMIARVGRGAPTFSKGVLGAVWDQEGLPVTQMFGLANIRQGSTQMTYISNQLAQQIIVTFINPDLNYQQDQVACTVPGVTAPEYTVTLNIPGITSKTQAAQEAALQAAAQYYFRRSLQFESDIEGLVCQKGDVVSISHDLLNWSYSGRLANVTGGSASLVILNREVTITADTQPYLSVRHPDGTYETVEVTNAVGTTNTLTLATPLSQNPYSYDAPNVAQDCLYSFDPAATPGRTMKVLSIQPLDSKGNQVRITCREENNAYYEAATDPTYIYVPPTLLNQNPATVTDITVTENTVQNVPGTQVTISWDMQEAAYAVLQVQEGTNAYTNYGNQYQNYFTFTVTTPCVLNIRLTAFSIAQVGQTANTATYTYTMTGTTQVPPEDVASQLPTVNGLEITGSPNSDEFTGKDAKFDWRVSGASAPEVGSEPQGGDSGQTDPYFLDYQVTILNPNGSTRRVDYTQNTNYTYSFEMNSEDGDGTPARAFTIEVTARGQQNQLSPYPASLSVSNPPPPTATGVQWLGGLSQITFSYNVPNDTAYVGCLIYGSTNSALTAGEAPLVLTSTSNNGIITQDSTGAALTAGDTYYMYISLYDTFGTTGLNVSSQYTVPTYLIGTIDLGPGSVTATQLAAAAVTTAAISPAAITSTLLAADAVTSAALAADAVTTAAIAAGAVTNANIAANTIEAGSIAAGTITSTQIATGTITTNNIASDTIVAGNIAAGTITGSLIAAATIDGTNIAAATITGGNITSDTITSGNIAANTITGGNIAANTIEAGNILSNTITASCLDLLTSGGTSIDMSAGTITFNNGSYMKVSGTGFGSSNQFLEWFGPSQSALSDCTETLATYYLKVDGTAYFGGELLAGTLFNSTQATVLTSSNIADLGPFTSNGGTITITASFSFTGEVDYPGTSTGLTDYDAATLANPTFTVILQRSYNGGAFSTVHTLNVTGTYDSLAPIPADVEPGYYRQFAGTSFTYTDPDTSTDNREYTLSFTAWNIDTYATLNDLSITSDEPA